MMAPACESDDLTMLLAERRAAIREAAARCRAERLRAAQLREERLLDGADRLTGRVVAALRALGRDRRARRGDGMA